jgi:hypothetical protein
MRPSGGVVPAAGIKQKDRVMVESTLVSRHFDDLDAVLCFDALDDFGQLIFALQSSPGFRSGVDQYLISTRCGG